MKKQCSSIPFIVATLLSISNPSASNADENLERSSTLKIYEKAVFASPDMKLIKINSDSSYDINVGCLGSGCEENVRQLGRILSDGKFKIHLSSDFDETTKINIVFISEQETQAFLDKKRFQKGDEEHVRTEVSKNCISFSILKKETKYVN